MLQSATNKVTTPKTKQKIKTFKHKVNKPRKRRRKTRDVEILMNPKRDKSTKKQLPVLFSIKSKV